MITGNVSLFGTGKNKFKLYKIGVSSTTVYGTVPGTRKSRSSEPCTQYLVVSHKIKQSTVGLYSVYSFLFRGTRGTQKYLYQVC